METEPMKLEAIEREDGELSDSEDLYTPLQRPKLAVGSPGSNFTLAQSAKNAPEPSSSDDNYSSDSTEDSDAGAGVKGGNNNKKRKEIRVKPMKPVRPTGRVRPEKYNIWAQTLQDDLMENMKGCEVRTDARDRNVESYDYLSKYRLNGESVPTKRRQSYSDDSDTYNNKSEPKRFKGRGNQPRISAKLRLGARVDSQDSCNSSDGINSVSRHILDLAVTRDSTNEEVAHDMAHKLAEAKDDLLLQAIKVIGREVPMRLFCETQRIEKDGGMLTINGQRRRTPGGVFLFLLKNCTDISEDEKKKIFTDDRKPEVKKKRNDHDVRRDRKVQQLKKSLNLNNAEKDLRDKLLKPDNPSLSNPPPSPVTDCNRESSPDFESSTKIVNKLEEAAPTPEPDKGEGSSSSSSNNRSSTQQQTVTVPTVDLNPYEDDFLDMTVDDMDLF